MSQAPILTDPPIAASVNENVAGDLIVRQGDVITNPQGFSYTAVSLLGHGQFGQVFQVIEQNPVSMLRQTFAMKVSKIQPPYLYQSQLEASVLNDINKLNNQDKEHLCQMRCSFFFKNHHCIVIELLSCDLYNVLKQKDFKGLSLFKVQIVMRDLLKSLVGLEKLGIVHSDVKPENILTQDQATLSVKLIDFGSSRRIAQQPPSPYIQSRYYRAPEVVLGLSHDFKIDIWSAACVGVEIFIGFPLFPGQSEFHLLMLISEMLGPFPSELIEQSPRRYDLFYPNGQLKTEEEYCAEKGLVPVSPSFQHYFQEQSLDTIILNYVKFSGRTPETLQEECRQRLKFLDLLKRMLIYDPAQRISAAEALNHPFFFADLSHRH